MKNRFLFFSIVIIVLTFIPFYFSSCGSSSSSGGSSGGNNGDGGSTGSGDNSTGFQITGQLSNLQVSLNSNLVKGAEHTGTVTDIMVVTPGTASVTCKKIEVESDGTFDFRITAGRPSFFYFFDRFKQGSNMFMGRFQSSTLDTLAPSSSSGSLDLSTVSIDSETQVANSDTTYEDLLTGLGLDSDTADTLGEVDDISTRYSNPDVDGNGDIDCDESNASFILDFHVRFDMLLNNSIATVNDMVDAFFDENTTTTFYQSTGVYVSYPNAFSTETTGSVTFATDVTTEEGGDVPANTATSDVTELSYGTNNGFGPNILNSSELPSGEIVFTFGDKELTFSGVQTPSLDALTAPTGRIFPFVKFNKSDSSCTSACTLEGISYKWMKKTVSGWTLATTSELDLLVSDEEAYLGFRVGGDESKYIGFKIPKSSVSGDIEWTTSNANLEGATEAEFTNLTTDQICHIGLSYDDKLGMRYFENIQNSSEDCTS